MLYAALKPLHNYLSFITQRTAGALRFGRAAMFLALLALPLLSGATDLSHSYSKGWHLVSAPLQPSNAAASAVFPAVGGRHDLSTLNSSGEWAAPTTIESGKSYWMLFSKPATVTVSGNTKPLTTQQISLIAGWNLISTPWPAPLAWDDTRVSVKQGSTSVSLTTAVSNGWIGGLCEFDGPTSETYTTRNASPDGGFQLQPWQGYAVRALSSDLTLVFAPPPPPGTSAPTVAFASPIDGQSVTEAFAVQGTVSDPDHDLIEYTLKYTAAGDSASTVFSVGTNTVTTATLGTFDPTLLKNGQYILTLTAKDLAGHVASSSVSIIVDGAQKLGNFSLTFSDVKIPASGLPVEIQRSYDTLDRGRLSDFGYGWSLGLKDVTVQENRRVGDGWTGSMSWDDDVDVYCLDESLKHVVTITLSTGEVFAFRPVLSESYSAFVAPQIVEVNYVAIPSRQGARGKLRGLDGNKAIVACRFPIQPDVNATAVLASFKDPSQPFDNDVYEFTTDEGVVLVINQYAGLRSMTDTNGNRLTIGDDGVFHSSGEGTLVSHNSQGRISAITDPRGNKTQYGYDSANNLVTVVDASGSTTTFNYNSDHYLTDIVDARGICAVRNTYDDAGRLIASTDAAGKQVSVEYDTAARKQTVTNRLGYKTVYEYDRAGNVVKETDALLGVIERGYNTRGDLLFETNQNGCTTRHSYDATGNRLTTTDPLGHATTTTYDTKNQPLTITEPGNRTVTVSYDNRNNPLQLRAPDKTALNFTYDGYGNVSTMVNEDGTTTTWSNDGGRQRVLSTTDATGIRTDYDYDDLGNKTLEVTTRTLENGAAEAVVTRYEYDGLNRLVKTIRPDSTSETVTWNAIGKEATRTDGLGRTTRFEYDDRALLVRTIYPDGSFISTEYDAQEQATTTTDELKRVTVRTYDPIGRVVRITHPDGAVDETVYDPAGQVIRTTSSCPCGGAARAEQRFEYDAAGRKTAMVNALNDRWRYEYDDLGNLIAETNPLSQTTRYQYDLLGNRTATVRADSTSETQTYDARGRLVTQTDALGRLTSFGYSARGELTTVTDALKQNTSYQYDEPGNLIRQIDALGHVTKYGYDAMRRRVWRELPLGQRENLLYDAAGQLVRRTHFNGASTEFAYDQRGRQTLRIPDPLRFPAEPSVVTTWTLTGKRSAMSDASGLTTWTYDDRDRVTEKRCAAGVLSYTWGPDGRLLSIKSDKASDGGTHLEYKYDAVGQLAEVEDAGVGATSYQWDKAGRLTGWLTPNGVRHSRQLDKVGRVNVQEITNSISHQPLARFTYTLAATGRRDAMAELSGRRSEWKYDDLDRLTTETITDPAGTSGTISYTLDAVGNRLARTSSVDGIDQQTFNYDDNDRLQSDTWDDNGNTTGSGASAFAYNSDDRLTGFTSGDANASFVYDGDGNRVAKTAAGQTTRFLVDTENPTGYAQVLEERDGNGTLTNVYSYGHDLLAQHPTGTQPSFYGYDALGSTRLLSSSGGAISDAYAYDAFGVQLAHTGTTPNLYRYTGEQMDDTMGLQYLRARYLNAGAGRFWVADRYEGDLLAPRTLPKYLYATASPINSIDPTGFVTLAEVQEEVNIQVNLETKVVKIGVKKSKDSCKKLMCGVAKASLNFQDHHRIPKYLGGAVNQDLLRIPLETHQSVHRLLHIIFKNAGLLGGLGGRGNSAEAWLKILSDATTTGQANQALVNAALLASGTFLDELCDFTPPDNFQSFIEKQLN